MRLTVSRSGGFAGLTRTWTIEVEQQPDQRAWLLLIEGLPWEDAPDAAAAPRPDRFVYDIRCAPHHARIGETELSGPWRELVDRVRAAG
jgi:hypothetical protein